MTPLPGKTDVIGQVLPLGQATLSELAERANAEHAEVLSGLRSTLEHAIRCGEALLEARTLVEGSWLEWLTANFNGAQATGQQYMRLAYHKDHILKSGEASMPLKRAYLYIRGLPPIDSQTRRGRVPLPRDEDVAEARRLLKSGMSYAEIGEVFNRNEKTIRVWLDPGQRKRANAAKRREYVRRKQARLALAQKERDQAAKKAGGNLAEAYSLMRKTAQALERASNEATSRDDKAALLDSLATLHKAEDKLVRALGIAHGAHARARTISAAA